MRTIYATKILQARSSLTFHDGGRYHIATSFYMIKASVMKGLKGNFGHIKSALKYLITLPQVSKFPFISVLSNIMQLTSISFYDFT